MKKSLNKIIESGIIVSLFLGLAYFFTYQYQKGFLDYYDLPLKYIDLSIENVVEIFIYFLGFLMCVFSITRIISINVPKLQSYKAKQILSVSVIYMVLVALSLVLLKAHSKPIITYTIFFVLYIIYCILAPFVFAKQEKNYIKKWQIYTEKSEKFFSKEIELKKESILYPYEKTIVMLGVLLMVIGIIGVFFGVSGKEQAQYAEEHYVAKDYSDKVVVYHTKDFYILKEETDGVLKDEFQIVSADEIGTLKKEKTGVLKLEEE